MKFICYPKCSTCQKARKWLDDNGIAYKLRDIKTENPTYEELAACTPSAVCRSRSFSTPAACCISQ